MKFLFIFAHKGDKYPREFLLEIGKHLREKKHEIRIVDLHKGPWDFKTLNDETQFDYPKEQKAAVQKKSFSEDIKNQMDLIKWCDNMFFFFPLTNYSFPTILKGYMDRVYAYYFAFGGLNTLSPRKFMFLVQDPNNVGKERIEKFFSNLYQTQNVSGVRNQGTFIYTGEDEKKETELEHAVKHIKYVYSWKNRFLENFNFPRLKMFGMFLK